MSTVDAILSTINLDPGDAGLVFISGVGFRPADGMEIGATRVLNQCVIKCQVGYDELPEGPTTYVPVCGGEDGTGKWAEKWTPPIDWTTPQPPLYAALTAPPVYSAPSTPGWSLPPWDEPIWECCTTTTVYRTPDPIMPSVDLPPGGLLLASVMIGAIIIRSAQTLRLAASIKDQF